MIYTCFTSLASRTCGLAALLLAACLSVSLHHATAQTRLDETWGRIWVLNEGRFGSQGAVGYLDFPCESYRHFDSIPRNSTDLHTFRGQVLVAGSDSLLYIYGREAGSRRSAKLFIRKFGLYETPEAVWLVASCLKPPFVRVYRTDASLSRFDPAWESTPEQAPNETDGVAIVATTGKAYISMNGFNGFGINGTTDNRVVVLNLSPAPAFKQHITVPANPNALLLEPEAQGGMPQRLFVQSLDYGLTGLTIAQINTQTDAVDAQFPTAHTSYGGFTYFEGIAFTFADPATFATLGVARLNLQTRAIDTLVQGSYSGVAYDPSFGYWVLPQTDYFSFGRLTVRDRNEAQLTQETAVSPAVFRFQFVGSPRTTTPPARPHCIDRVFNFSDRLAGPLAGFRWSDGYPDLNRTVERAGTYELTYRLTESCSFTLATSFSTPIPRPDFAFTTPDTVDLSVPNNVIELSGPLARFPGSRWVITEPLELLGADTDDAVSVRIIAPRSGWYYYAAAVRSETCLFLFEDSVYVRVPVSRVGVDGAARPLTLFPNPVASGGRVELAAGPHEWQTLQLHDPQGRVLHRWPAGSPISLDLPALPAGVYLLVGTDRQGLRATSRLVVHP